jgi:hypothetical protein
MDFLIRTEHTVTGMKKYDYTELGAISELIKKLKEIYEKQEKSSDRSELLESKLPFLLN